jgi:hypothetical protein
MHERWRSIAPKPVSSVTGARTKIEQAQQSLKKTSLFDDEFSWPNGPEIPLQFVHDRFAWKHYSIDRCSLSIKGGLWSKVSQQIDGGAHVAMPLA